MTVVLWTGTTPSVALELIASESPESSLEMQNLKPSHPRLSADISGRGPAIYISPPGDSGVHWNWRTMALVSVSA